MTLHKFARSFSIRIFTAWAVLLTPLAAALGQTPQRAAVSQAFLTRESVVAICLRPKQILTSEAAQMLPVEIAQAAGEKYIGMDLAHVVRAIAVGEPPMGPNPYYAVILQADQPFQIDRFAPELTMHTQPGQIAGHDCLVSQHPALPCLMILNERTLVAATPGMLEKLLDQSREKADGVLAKLVGQQTSGDDLYVAVDLVPLRPLIQLGLMQAQATAPPEAQTFFQSPNFLESVELTFNLNPGRATRLVAHTPGETEAGQLETILDEGMQMMQTRMRADLDAQMAQLRASDDPVQQATAAYADRMSQAYMNAFRPKRKGNSFVLFNQESLPAVQANAATIGILVALLLPAVQAAREAARRNQSTNNMKQLMLALLNYESANGQFPPHAIYSADGQPLLSWRVAILPYLEQQALYDQFHLDEPWDSEHNRALIAQMPAILLDPSSGLTPEQGRTHYVGPVGEGAFFTGTNQGLGMREITDGTSNTIAVLQVDEAQAAVWTKPDDWAYDKATPLRGLHGSPHPGIFLAAFADGHVTPVAEAVDAETFGKMLTVAGGEPMQATW